MYKHTKKILLSLAVIAVPIISWAVITNSKTNNVNKDTSSAIKKMIAENLGVKGDIPINITNSPINGILEVEVQGQIIYATSDARYVLLGNLLDTKNKVNLTQEKVEKIQTVKWSDLPTSNALLWQKGKFNPKRQIAIFADPNCGFCKKMEQELQKLENITVHTFLVPILSPDSLTKAVDIWCQPKNTEVWRDWMLNHKTPPPAMSNCKNPVQGNAELARKLGINGTPAIIFMDGSRNNGLITADELSSKIDALAQK
jgi:thiol:disulfide interchange protein DsbC